VSDEQERGERKDKVRRGRGVVERGTRKEEAEGYRCAVDDKKGKRSFGYKDQIKIDERSKLIDRYEVTSAEVHDSQGIEMLLSEEDKGQEIYADSAYIGQGENQRYVVGLNMCLDLSRTA